MRQFSIRSASTALAERGGWPAFAFFGDRRQLERATAGRGGSGARSAGAVLEKRKRAERAAEEREVCGGRPAFAFLGHAREAEPAAAGTGVSGALGGLPFLGNRREADSAAKRDWVRELGLAFALLWIWALPLAAQSAYDKGNDHLRAGRLAEAEQAYRLHLKTNPNDAQALANLGATQARRENFAGAIESYQRALKAAPSLTPIYLNLGLAYYKSRQWAQALGAFDSFLQFQGGHRQARQLRALSLLELERYPEAAQAFEALMPTGDATILIGLATAYTKSNRAADAQKLLGPLLEQGTSPELQLTLGQAYFAEGQDSDALAAFERARALNPKLPTLGLHIGAVLWRQRKLPEAVAEWRAELDRFPESAEALFTLGTAIALTGGDPKEPERLLRKALAKKPNHARANYQLAKLIWQQRKAPEAISCLERAVKNDPELREAYYLLGRVYQDTGRKADAQRVFARVKELADKARSRQLDLFSEPPPQ